MAFLIAFPVLLDAQTATPTAAVPISDIQTMAPIYVTAEAPTPEQREQINTAIGTDTYTITQQQIDTIAQGENSSFNQILARTPGTSSDTYGAIHFRNEDPYYRYYINGTLLPSGINGFSQDIDTRFVQSVTLKIGALPAYYPEGNYGIVDITTKSGAALNGGELSFYGGSFDTFHPTLSYGGTSKGTDFYFTGSYLHDDLGLENPTNGATENHDETNQYRGMAYISHQFDGGGRLSLLLSGANQDYKIPNTPGQAPSDDFTGTEVPPADESSNVLNERQNEQTYYGFIAYQQSFDDWSFQLSQVNRSSTVHFSPDVNGDLLYNGVAADVKQYILVNGVQADFTWQADPSHTVRFGVTGDTQIAGAHNTTVAYPTDVNGDPTGLPESFTDDHSKRAYDLGIYAQDEWKATDQLTVNFGLRFESVNAYTNDSQWSPRINAVYQIDQATAFHAGYARYFDPPQLLNISSGNVTQFDNTTNAADQDQNDAIKVEKSHYFDAGITHDFLPNLTVGLDSYYKIARDQIDDGQFGAANISSPYNYGEASMYGAELSVDYTQGGFTAYGNFAASDSWAKHIVSAQFEFDADELPAIDATSVRFDQQQLLTASAGAAYRWEDTTFHVDALYADGIRAGFVNQSKLKPYYPVNIGVEHAFKIPRTGDVTVRLDVLNLFDQVYILNDGTGIGEGAVKYGNRRGIYGGVSYTF